MKRYFLFHLSTHSFIFLLHYFAFFFTFMLPQIHVTVLSCSHVRVSDLSHLCHWVIHVCSAEMNVSE